MYFSTLPDVSAYYQGANPTTEQPIYTPSPETINQISLAGNCILFLLLMSYVAIDTHTKRRQIARYQKMQKLEENWHLTAQQDTQTEIKRQQIEILRRMWELTLKRNNETSS